MNVIDSSCWLEYFAGSDHAKPYEGLIDKGSEILVPSIVLFEVYRKILKEAGRKEALEKVAHLQMFDVVELTSSLAVEAGKLSFDVGLPMADSIILATARKHGAVLWTHDSDFREVEGVRYFGKR